MVKHISDRVGVMYLGNMMELAESGNIGTIIVKDHSRLGRNRLVVGQLLEEDFVLTSLLQKL